MATFTKLDQLADHGKYKALLKTAMAKVRDTPVRFSYFEKYKFGDKTFPLVLVDMDPALVNEVKKTAGNTTAIGKCRLNDHDEIVFDAESGRLSHARVKKYLSTFTGVKKVWVPAGEEEAEETEAETPKATTAKPGPQQTTAQQTAPQKTAPQQTDIVARFNRMLAEAKQAIAQHPEQKGELTDAITAAQGLIKAGSLGEAQKTLDKAEAMLKGGGGPNLAEWQAARNEVVATLKELENKIRAMADPESDAAIILVKSIQANLAGNPTTLQKLAELEGYLKSDSVITDAESPNGFGIKVQIRGPLLAALAKLKLQLKA